MVKSAGVLGRAGSGGHRGRDGAASTETGCEPLGTRLGEIVGGAGGLADLVRLTVEDDRVYAGVRTSSHERLLKRRIGEALDRVVRESLGADAAVEWRTEPGAFVELEEELDGGDAEAGADAPPRAPGQPGRWVRKERTRYTLDDFVVGECNRVAYTTAMRVIDDAESDAVQTLCLHGVCGVGKTHLLNALADAFRRRNGRGAVRCVTGESFANEFIACLQVGRIEEFRRRYRDVELLCIDDVHFLGVGDKRKTQEEFLHTFESLELHGGRVVLASDEHPKHIKSLHAGLVSRCLAGAVLRMDRPDFATRVGIAERRLAAKGLPWDSEGIEEIARAAPGSARDLIGMVEKVAAYSGMPGEGGAVDRVLVHRVLNECGGVAVPRSIRVDDVLRAACHAAGVEVSEVLGPSRHKRVVLARSMACWLLRDLTRMSLPEIARGLHLRTHTTVHAAVKRTEERRRRNELTNCGGDLQDVRVRTLLERVRDELVTNARG